MLIDSFAETGLSELQRRECDPALGRYLLIDGAFVPGLHKLLEEDQKAILFALLPACPEQARDMSPFLTPFDPGARAQARLLQRCVCWPMVSLIETRESITALSQRLAAWCVVEADGQNFNFRFADTRRLPAIYENLDILQRAQFAGPAVNWLYCARDGTLRELALGGSDAGVADNPTLDQAQFAALVEDSHADEILALLRNRGHEVYRSPSRSHALVVLALKVATAASIPNDDLIGWCVLFWREDQLSDYATACARLEKWRSDSI